MINTTKTPDEETRLRDHMANERTFLAWVRTSIGIMAFGFVVEKFSLFIREMASLMGKAPISQAPLAWQGTSSVLGIALVAIGALICLLAFIKYKATYDQIELNAYTPSFTLNKFLTLFILLVGLLLVTYLSISI